jgi:hypothetical protein
MYCDVSVNEEGTDGCSIFDETKLSPLLFFGTDESYHVCHKVQSTFYFRDENHTEMSPIGIHHIVSPHARSLVSGFATPQADPRHPQRPRRALVAFWYPVAEHLGSVFWPRRKLLEGSNLGSDELSRPWCFA